MQKLMKQNTLATQDIVSFSGGDYFAELHPQLVSQMRAFISKKAPKKRIKTMRPKKYLSTYPDTPLKKHRGYRSIESFPIDIQVYGDIVTISAIDQGHPIAISVEHSAIAQGMRLLFDEIWQSSDDRAK